jgi:UDP-N-acetylmuramate dehydrogenase
MSGINSRLKNINELLSAHTTFKVGGAADVYIKPDTEHFFECVSDCIVEAKKCFILGGGSNLVVSDSGIRGTVLDVSGYADTFETSVVYDNTILELKAGTLSDTASDIALEHGLSGLEFLSGLPGTIGGASYMNARCFERQISDVLCEVQVVDRSNNVCTPYRYVPHPESFGYKKSPFQNSRMIICGVRFKLKYGDKDSIQQLMTKYKTIRTQKHQYEYPSAGSVFKNNHSFGKPTGQIIEELGLCGKCSGGAQIAPWHGNFIINLGYATAKDILSLVKLTENTAEKILNIKLEREILFV